MKTRTLIIIGIATIFSVTHNLRAQGTAFNYQGKLNSGANPATGSYDLTFTLFPTNTGGTQAAGTFTNSATAVSNGLFSVMLDFGTGVFTGGSYWVKVGVRTNGIRRVDRRL